MNRNAWIVVLSLAALLQVCAGQSAKVPDMPSHLVIGRDSFIDIGPPFHYYEVMTLDSVPGGVRVERAQMSEPSDSCTRAAEYKLNVATIKQTMAELVAGRNVCAIPEKELNRKRKDCKHCLVFSGANVVVQAECNGQTRLIRADILDRDIFDSRTKTPSGVAWSMALLGRLDSSLGDNVADRPLFTTEEKPQPEVASVDDPLTMLISEQRFDGLFGGGDDRPSVLLSRSRETPQRPSVTLQSAAPLVPSSPTMPLYPPIARAAHVSGYVELSADISAGGVVEGVRIASGPKMLEGSALEAVRKWEFPGTGLSTVEHVVIDYQMHCPAGTQ